MPATTTPLCTSCPPRRREVYDQLDANGQGGHTAHLALAPIDATGKLGPPCYWVTFNGMRPAQR